LKIVRFYIDPETSRPHILNHGVLPAEVQSALRKPVEDRIGRNGSRVAIGKTDQGRYLKVIYAPGRISNAVFVQSELSRIACAPAKAQEEAMDDSRYPPGWNEQRVRRVIDHYDKLSEMERIAEDEAAFDETTETTMTVPVELVPAVRELIAKHRSK
jgi:hypothetical protein